MRIEHSVMMNSLLQWIPNHHYRSDDLFVFIRLVTRGFYFEIVEVCEMKHHGDLKRTIGSMIYYWWEQLCSNSG